MDSSDSVRWPPSIEVEKWLMNTTKDGDNGAQFLRKMVQMNPAYGAYMVDDQHLRGIVQLFARRFRARVLDSDKTLDSLRGDTNAKALFEPLCEMVWRTVGQVLYSIMDLEDMEHLPLPKEPLGQVKMLLQTNVALSQKFNEMRRAYLRELTVFREMHRTHSSETSEVLKSLEEHPVMFYEPLEFVLDETTKKFVREVIEERVKLGSAFADKDGAAEEKQEEVAESDNGAAMIKRLKNEIKALERDIEKLKAELEKERNARKQAEADKAALEKQLQEEREAAERLRAELEEMRAEVQGLKSQLAGVPPPVVEDPDRPTTAAYKALEAKHKKEMEEMMDKLKKEQERVKALEDELAALRAMLEKLKNQPPPKPTVVKGETKMVDNSAELEAKDRELEELRKKLRDQAAEIADLKKQIERCLEIEKELRGAIKALEKALDDAKEKAKYSGKKGSTDDEIADAMRKVTEAHRKALAEKDAEIAELNRLLALKEKELEALRKENEKLRNQKPDAPPPPAKFDGVSKAKYQALKDENEKLKEKIAELEDQVRALLMKLGEIGGEELVRQMMEQMKLDPALGKFQKQKAWQRLWLDAQRRFSDFEIRQQSIDMLGLQVLVDLQKMIKDRKTLREAEALGHLHKAAEATRNRFMSALTTFVARNAERLKDERDASPEREIQEVSRQPSPARGRSSSPTTLRDHGLQQSFITLDGEFTGHLSIIPPDDIRGARTPSPQHRTPVNRAPSPFGGGMLVSRPLLGRQVSAVADQGATMSSTSMQSLNALQVPPAQKLQPSQSVPSLMSTQMPTQMSSKRTSSHTQPSTTAGSQQQHVASSFPTFGQLTASEKRLARAQPGAVGQPATPPAAALKNPPVPPAAQTLQATRPWRQDTLQVGERDPGGQTATRTAQQPVLGVEPPWRRGGTPDREAGGAKARAAGWLPMGQGAGSAAVPGRAPATGLLEPLSKKGGSRSGSPPRASPSGSPEDRGARRATDNSFAAPAGVGAPARSRAQGLQAEGPLGVRIIASQHSMATTS